MSGTIDPNTPLLVTLPARSWNSLLMMAGEGIGSLNAIMADVQRQCMRQTQQPNDEAEHIPARGAPPRPHPAPRPNGEATP